MTATVEQTEDRGEAIVEFIAAYVAEYGSAPSIREIGDAVGLKSTSGVHYRLLALEKAGVIVRRPNLARSIVIPGPRVAA